MHFNKWCPIFYFSYRTNSSYFSKSIYKPFGMGYNIKKYKVNISRMRDDRR